MERNNALTGLSQILRRNMTKEERLLWNCFLKKYPLQFRRQYVIGNYVADFYCHKTRLVVELDGSGRYEPETIQRDLARTQYLQSQGLEVLRFTNLEVTRQFRSVCDLIDAQAKNASPGGKLSAKLTEEERRDPIFSSKHQQKQKSKNICPHSSSAPSGHLLPGRRVLRQIRERIYASRKQQGRSAF